MAKKTRNILKGYFETGKKPSEGNYTDLIDSHALLSGENTGSFSLKGAISASNISASGETTSVTFKGNTGTFTTLTNVNTPNVTASNNISASGYISGSSIYADTIVAGGRITADQFKGDGRLLTGITASHISVSAATATYSGDTLLVSGSLYHPSASATILLGIKSTGSIIPGGDGEFDLGSPTNYFKDLFVSHSHVQSIKAENTIVATTIDTGQGANELYAMDQNVRTTDNVQFAHITSSGNISGSSTSTLTIGGDATINNLIATHITSSGNISSSGTITAEQLTTSDDLTVGDRITTEYANVNLGLTVNVDAAGGGDFRVKSVNNNYMIFSDANKDKVGIGFGTVSGNDLSSSLHISGDLTTDSHITASGNISASGIVTADSIILTAPNGNKFKFTTNNSGYLSTTGSAV